MRFSPRIRSSNPTGAAILGLLVALGCGEADADEGGHGRPPARVAVGEVTAGSVTVRWTFFGEVEALARAELAAGADGTVRRVLVREGDRVEAGQLLVDVDTSVVRARLRAAQLDRETTNRELSQARRDAERLAMAGTRLVSESEIERAQNRVDVLDAQSTRQGAGAREIAAALQRHRVTAPFAGVVADRRVDPGDYVAPGTPALVLVGDDAVQIRCEVHPDAASFLEVGAEATLRRGDVELPARIGGIVRALDPTTRTVRIRIVPEGNTPSWLVAGQTVDVVFEVQRSEEGALVVPLDAVVSGAAGARRVVRVVEGQAALVGVEVLAESDTQALVRPASPLSAGDAVVTRGNERLRPEQPLEVLE